MNTPTPQGNDSPTPAERAGETDALDKMMANVRYNKERDWEVGYGQLLDFARRLESERNEARATLARVDAILGHRGHDVIQSAEDRMADIREFDAQLAKLIADYIELRNDAAKMADDNIALRRVAPTGQERETLKVIEDLCGQSYKHPLTEAGFYERSERLGKIQNIAGAALAQRPAGPSDGAMLDWLATYPFFRMGWMTNLLRNAQPGKANLRQAIVAAMSARDEGEKKS